MTIINTKNLNPSDLAITLDGEPTNDSGQHPVYYSPGQTITGKATYTPSSEVKVSGVSIVFSGTLYSEHKEQELCVSINSAYYSNGALTKKSNIFRQERKLVDGKYNLTPTKHEWAFEFVLPEKVRMPFAAEEQPIPPTWDILQVARATYALRLVVIPRRSNRAIEIHKGVNVWPYHNTRLPPPQPVGYEFHSDTQKKSRKLSLARWRSNSSATSLGTDVSVKIKMPHSVGLWQTFPLELSCLADPSETPELVLDHCQLSLRADVVYTGYKNGGMEPNPNCLEKDGSLPRICGFKLRGQGCKIPVDGSFVTIKQRARLADMSPRTDVLIPNFSISYVTLSYVMEVTVHLVDTRTAQLVERTGKFTFQILPSGLVSPVDDGETADADAPPAFHEVESPPDYESMHVWTT